MSHPQQVPQVLDLVFYLGKNAKTGAPQWKSDEVSGRMSVIYVPDNFSVLKPTEEQKRFLCYRGRTVFTSPSKTFMIVSVDLFEAIAEQVKQAVELEVDLDLIEYDYEVEVRRGVNSKTKTEQWESRVYDKENDFTTLYVVDRESPVVPTMNGEKFAAVEKAELYNDGASFAIVIVSLVAKLDPEKLIVTWSDVARRVKSPAPSTTSVVGTISKIKHGRSAEKRFADSERRTSMKGAGKGGGKKDQRKSA